MSFITPFLKATAASKITYIAPQFYSLNVAIRRFTSNTSSNTSSNVNPTEPPREKSYILKGMPLKGLNYSSKGEELIALDDSEYPEWLWTLLQSKKASEMTANDISESDSSDPRTARLLLKAQNKAGIKKANFLKKKKK
ncbi:54S ribosomal protein L37, mitochondrial [Zancudomyces culisetae]|uniref:Large ribosomal subunit protein mL54 n=1 Tax=Zancudomyces culisetae TaxID=1213189 RepID=A0A1R1PPU3_ZANCU|nr:54S ribosomal protein L37, mitochondrial [Zancudomyces culisetae]|eukprot:OMH82969.1 54S ribosomal protein L37, mitochondrial [Zancudomyces culisetae]